ncbi:glycosyltransferase [Propioniciclava sinopodophylli]|uniref:Glycosyltransferase n=1 Tax=Propioniciclava sinopodophylli TaxID=1837344 RepID=A0A4Q9KAQ1_9ACTN|nr:glycosyltransferase [Propioniciclava sinopodophylli]TBT82578.1 glycosyltransferase [Propioniciclava sinopodophylli]
MHGVSIIVTSFNRGAFVEEAVDSALAQTYGDTEVIIVDDGSTDPETHRVLKRLAARGLNVIVQPNAGVSAARNTGIRASRGEWILCLDDDDIIATTYAEKAVSRFQSDAEVRVVYSGGRFFGGNSRQWKLDPYSPGRIALGNCLPSASFFKRSDWGAVGGFDEGLPTFEDWDFWLRLSSLGGKFAKLEEELFFYRIGHDSITNSHIASAEGEMVAAECRKRIERKNREFLLSQFDYVYEACQRLDREVKEWRWTYGTIDVRWGASIRRILPVAKRVRKALLRRT